MRTKKEEITAGWQSLTPTDLDQLNAAAAEEHYAVQLVAAVGQSLLPKQADDGQSNTGWWPEQGALVSHDLGEGVRLGFHPGDFALQVFEGHHVSAGYALAGQTLEAAQKWIESQFPAQAIAWDMHYTIPDHPIAAGAPFSSSMVPLHNTWAKWRHNANLVLGQYAQTFPGNSAVRTWPHHFDTGSYLPQRRDAAGAPVNSISLGLAIADAVVAEPYFYVTHWAVEQLHYPNVLPDLPLYAYWTTEEFVGAILPLSAIAAQPTPAEQINVLTRYLDKAIPASLGLIGQ